jgi:hypothetical protein
LIFIFLFWWQVFSSWKIRFFRFPLPPPHQPQKPYKKKKKKTLTWYSPLFFLRPLPYRNQGKIIFKLKKREKKRKKRGWGGGVQEKVFKRKHFLPILFISGCPGEGEKKKGRGVQK